MKTNPVTLLAIMFVCLAQATPPINESTVVGVWEAIDKDCMRIFRIDVCSNQPSYLCLSCPAGATQGTTLCKMEKLSVKNGRAYMVFRELSDTNSTITVAGSGVARKDGETNEGFLEASLFFNVPGSSFYITKVEFVKHSDASCNSYLEKLHALSVAAKQAVLKTRESNNNQQSTSTVQKIAEPQQ